MLYGLIRRNHVRPTDVDVDVVAAPASVSGDILSIFETHHTFKFHM